MDYIRSAGPGAVAVTNQQLAHRRNRFQQCMTPAVALRFLRVSLAHAGWSPDLPDTETETSLTTRV
jgi:hypothetical protein